MRIDSLSAFENGRKIMGNIKHTALAELAAKDATKVSTSPYPEIKSTKDLYDHFIGSKQHIK